MTASHRDLASAIRMLSADAVETAKSGHLGLPLGFADVAVVLFDKFLKFDAARPDWPDRDRLILSAGHGSMLLYSLLYLTGTPGVTQDQIRNFRQLGSNTAGHPEVGHTPGVETTTGPLGQGLANSTGFALAEAILAEQYGSDLVDHRTWVIAGDGCLMEGVSQEAITLAAHLKLGKLIVLWDDNRITIDGNVDLSNSDDQSARFKAAGWRVLSCEGHDPADIERALAEASQDSEGQPTLVACRTIAGWGTPKADTAKAHGGPYGEEAITALRNKLDWVYEPFEVPEHILSAWREIGARGAAQSAQWDKRAAASAKGNAFVAQMKSELPEGWNKGLREAMQAAAEEMPKLATRASSGKALEALVGTVPGMIGGSADLTGSNNTKTSHSTDIAPGSYAGNYVNYGVREHGMAAAMNGMALHGGLVPYAGTFLVFADYARPSIRLSALMNQHVIYVLTHDSIGVGEDGPTHQPVEHVASLRAIPNLDVYRPADLVETLECWELAIERKKPCVIALSRQGTPALRKNVTDNFSAYGGYIFSPSTKDRQVTLIGTGTELALALEAKEILEGEHGIGTAVVSMPCIEIFKEHSAHFRQEVLSPGTLRVAIEAGVRQGWDRFIHEDGIFVGMDSFGASAPGGELFKHFGITTDAIVERVLAAV